jgi:copper(I)-binding protein
MRDKKSSAGILAGIVCAILVEAVAFFPIAAIAHGYDVGPIHVEHPWTRATPNGAQVAGGYMTITNRGPEPDRLIGGSFAAGSRFVIHKMTMDQGVMKMRPLDTALEIKPGETVELSGSLHVMFEGLKQPLKAGDRVKGTLVFEKAGTIEIEYSVEGMGAKIPSDTSAHGH